ncbi:MAG: hypothetical protein PHC91_04890, partial [Eubacteriales bacterium]|nr:hypothetical protein [Eubacteriales bacterium]
DQNAKYLAQLSPYWDENTWKDVFYRYNKDLIAEVIAIETGDYNKALDVFDIVMEEALERGDYYAEGLIHFLPKDQQQIPPAYFNMIKDFRKINTEWAYLSRFYIVAKIAGLGDEEYVTQRFYALARRMKDKFELVLGTEIADELLNLSSIYAIRLEQMVDAILTGDQTSIETQMNELNQYADRQATYLSSINPYWDETIWKELFYAFNGFLLEESYEFQRKDYVAAMQTFEKLLYTALSIGDNFAQGLYQYALINVKRAFSLGLL